MDEIISELKKIAEGATDIFGDLSDEQINWKPAPDSWSVGQCFEHLIISNELFFDELDKIARGERKNSFWESVSPLSKLGGNFLRKSLESDQRKFKVPTQKIAPPSGVDKNIIEKFALHQGTLVEKIAAAQKVDCTKIVVTSPFLSVMTYKLKDGLEIIVAHEKRHSRQARRVMDMDGFPKSDV